MKKHKKYFAVDLIVIALIGLYLILIILNNRYALWVGIVGYGIFLVRAIMGLIEERRAKNKKI